VQIIFLGITIQHGFTRSVSAQAQGHCCWLRQLVCLMFMFMFIFIFMFNFNVVVFVIVTIISYLFPLFFSLSQHFPWREKEREGRPMVRSIVELKADFFQSCTPPLGSLRLTLGSHSQGLCHCQDCRRECCQQLRSL